MSQHRLCLGVLLLIFGVSNELHAKDFLIAPGEAWPNPEHTIAPGDRILLAPGAHAAKVVRELRGTADAPIVIDSVDPTKPAMIIGGDYSLDLIQCAHVHIGSMLYLGSKLAGIRVTGTSENPSKGIRINNGTISKPTPDATAYIGIIGRWVDSFTIEAMQITDCIRASIDVSNANDLIIRNMSLVGSFQTQRGIVLGNNVHRATLEHISIQNATVSGFQLGVNPTHVKKESPLFALSDIVIEGCISYKCKLPIEIGSVAKLQIEHCTLFNPISCAIAFKPSLPPFAPAKEITFSGNLISWVVGTLTRFICNPDIAEELTIDSNLWWSDEMPEAAEYLGPLPGLADERQIYDVDPKLQQFKLNPVTPAAQAYGHTAKKLRKNRRTPPPGDTPNTKSGNNPSGT